LGEQHQPSRPDVCPRAEPEHRQGHRQRGQMVGEDVRVEPREDDLVAEYRKGRERQDDEHEPGVLSAGGDRRRARSSARLPRPASGYFCGRHTSVPDTSRSGPSIGGMGSRRTGRISANFSPSLTMMSAASLYQRKLYPSWDTPTSTSALSYLPGPLYRST